MNTVQEKQDKQLDSIIKHHEDKPGALLGILEEVQRLDAHRFLNEESLRSISKKMRIPLSAIYSVVTFYSYFNLKPQGEHSMVVCRGTACHTRGSLGLLMEVAALLGAQDFLEDEEAAFTTHDMKFTVKTVACFGQCALAPVIAVDGAIHSNMTCARIADVLAAVGKAATK